jgi:prevent-host-death family protein
MKTIGTRELRDDLSGVLSKAQKAPVVVTRHGAPAAVIIGVEDMDWDEIELGTSDRLWRELERRRQDPQLVSFEDALKSWGLEKK